MAAAARRAGRDPATVQLVAVSKKTAVTRIAEVARAGQLLFGENYLQEATAKVALLGPPLRWHFIGHLQSNKARQVAELFDMVETVDRLKVGRALDGHLGKIGKVMAVLVEVNIGREPQKSGVLPEEVAELLLGLAACRQLRVLGLMTMPPFCREAEEVRPYFRQLRQLAESLTAQGLLGREGPVELSMGMSADFEVAIEEGATLVRVGTALFGERA